MNQDIEIPLIFADFVQSIPDPRRNSWNVVHTMEKLLLIALLAMLSGADDFVSIAQWGQWNEEFLARFLDVQEGIPSHDTFNRVFSMLSNETLNESFMELIKCMESRVEGLVALDGKVLRGSKKNGVLPVQLLNAFCTTTGLTLGQWALEGNESEITGLKKFLKILELSGQTVSIDAIGCQVELAQALLEKNADYLLRVKGNQPKLHSAIYDAFLPLEAEITEPSAHFLFGEPVVEKDHGRLEIRTSYAINDLEGIEVLSRWPGCAAILCVKSSRQILLTDHYSTTTKYFITSKRIDTPEELQQLTSYARMHWGIENKLHWILDVVMNEDESTVRDLNAAANLSSFRKLTLNFLKQYKGTPKSMKKKLFRAANDKKFLLQLFQVLM